MEGGNIEVPPNVRRYFFPRENVLNFGKTVFFATNTCFFINIQYLIPPFHSFFGGIETIKRQDRSASLNSKIKIPRARAFAGKEKVPACLPIWILLGS